MVDGFNDPYNSDYYQPSRNTKTRTDINSATRTTEVRNEFLLVPNDISGIRDVLLVDGSLQNDPKGNTSRLEYNQDTYLVKTPASGSASTSFETARLGQYRPGSEAIAGVYFQKETPPVGKVEWGYFREERTLNGTNVGQDGLYWRQESDGSLSFVVEREGAETVIPQSEWAYQDGDPREIRDENGDVSGLLYGLDSLAGQQIPRHELDVSEGYIYRIDFSWYGGGIIAPKVLMMDRFGNQRGIEAFAFKPVGQTSIAKPNQPISVRLDNQGTSEADQCKVAGRQFSITGDFEQIRRETSHLETEISLGTTEQFLLAFRRKPEARGIEMGLNDIISAVDQTSFLSLVINADFGSQIPNWQDPSGTNSPQETGLQVATQDGTGTALSVDTSNGFRYNGTIIGTGKNESTVSGRGPIRFPVIREQPVAILGRSITGNAGSLDLNPRFVEAW